MANITDEMMKSLRALKVPSKADQEKLEHYLRGFEAEDILFENGPDGNPVVSHTIFLLYVNYPTLSDKSVAASNKKVLDNFSDSVQMKEGLENNLSPRTK